MLLGLLELILDEPLGTTWYRLALLGNNGHPLVLGGTPKVPIICTSWHDLVVCRLDLILDVPLSYRTPVVVCLLEQPCTIPIERCGEPPVEEAVVLMRRTLAPVDQARAGRVVVVRELLPVGHGGGGELVSLHLLLLVFGYVDASSDLEN